MKFSRRIQISDTDATGYIYFPALQKIAQEAFLSMLRERIQLTLADILSNQEYLLPIRHVEAEYFIPVFVDDVLDCSVRISKIGETSLTYECDLFRAKELVGKVTFVHVRISRKTNRPDPFPESMRTQLESCT